MHRFTYISMLVILIMITACASTTPIYPTQTPSGSLITETVSPPTPTTYPTPTPSSGIVGLVTEGPMCPGPVPVGNNTCPDQPYQATIEIVNAENALVAQTQSDINGYFKIELPAGTYTLHPISSTRFPYAGDQTVVVNPGQYTQVTVLFDTGMR